MLTISQFLNAHAYALDKDVSVNTNTTISENKDEVLKDFEAFDDYVYGLMEENAYSSQENG